MKSIRITGPTASLLLLSATFIPVYALGDSSPHKQGKHEKNVAQHQEQVKQHQEHVEKHQDHVAQHQEHVEKHQENVAQHQEHVEKHQEHVAKHQEHWEEKHEHHPQHSAQEVRHWQDNHGWREHGGWGEHGSWREHRSMRWARDHRTWVQRGGYRGYFIPHDRFILYFGPRHYFRISRPVIYLGYPRFVYRETSFIFVDPYPAEWGDGWYDSDDVYVDYTDGYYLYNRRHPGISIAINILQ